MRTVVKMLASVLISRRKSCAANRPSPSCSGSVFDVAAIETFTPAMLVTLGEKGVKTLDDLADLASDELIEMLGEGALDEATANDVIMAARAHWFADDAAKEDGHA